MTSISLAKTSMVMARQLHKIRSGRAIGVVISRAAQCFDRSLGADDCDELLTWFRRYGGHRRDWRAGTQDLPTTDRKVGPWGCEWEPRP